MPIPTLAANMCIECGTSLATIPRLFTLTGPKCVKCYFPSRTSIDGAESAA